MTGKTFTERLYDAGYAVRNYDINANVDCWRYRDESIRTPAGVVQKTYLTDAELDKIGGRRYFKGALPVAKIEVIREVANKA